jgi:hypothetical protein
MDPNIVELTQKSAAFLMPLLPYKIGDKAAEEVGKEIGGEAWNQAKALREKLRPKVEVKPAAEHGKFGGEKICEAGVFRVRLYVLQYEL